MLYAARQYMYVAVQQWLMCILHVYMSIVCLYVAHVPVFTCVHVCAGTVCMYIYMYKCNVHVLVQCTCTYMCLFAAARSPQVYCIFPPGVQVCVVNNAGHCCPTHHSASVL